MADSPADKEDRKREYNRLAQREFRRRRKEHLKSLEQAQKEQTSEQSGEIERLRKQNADLRRENEALKSQLYGSSLGSSLPHMSISGPLGSGGQDRSFSASPSVSSTMDSISGTGSPTATMAPDLMPMRSMAMTTSMLPPVMAAYADPLPMSSLHNQAYSMVHPSSARKSSKSSQGSSEFGSSQSSMGPTFQSLNLGTPSSGRMPTSRQSSLSRPNTMVVTPYDRNKARADLVVLFSPLLSDPLNLTAPEKHLSILRSMADTLPAVLKPTPSQLKTPHFYGIDTLCSASLRNILVGAGPEVAEAFVTEIGWCGGESEDNGQVIIWGDEALDEMSWEFSQPVLERWGWLLGREWVARANFWRRQRGANLLPEW